MRSVRSVGYILSRVLLSLVLLRMGTLLVQLRLTPPHTAWAQSPYQVIEGTLASIVGTLLLTWLVLALIERSPSTLLRLGGSILGNLRLAAAGILGGAALVSLTVALQWVMGAITYAGFIWEWRQDYVSLILPWLIFHLHVSFREELVFRGYLLGILARKKGYLFAIALSSIAFSLVHWLNYPFNLLFYLNLALAGVLLSLIRLHFNSLWPAIGFHLGWNWMQYHVFGYGVSTLIRFSPNPEMTWLLTGLERFERECTLIDTVLTVLAIWYFWRKISGREGFISKRSTEITKTVGERDPEDSISI